METCNDAPVRFLLAIARRSALRVGLAGEDAEECALLFAAEHCAAPSPPGVRCREAWLHTCAHHHAADYRRALSRRRQHERPWPEIFETDCVCAPFDLPDDCLDPGAAVLQDECWRQVVAALLDLGETPLELWARHAFFGTPVERLARSTGKTPEAVRKVLSRASKHVAASLLRAGWTQEDVCRAFSPPPP